MAGGGGRVSGIQPGVAEFGGDVFAAGAVGGAGGCVLEVDGGSAGNGIRGSFEGKGSFGAQRVCGGAEDFGGDDWARWNGIVAESGFEPCAVAGRERLGGRGADAAWYFGLGPELQRGT